MLQAREYAGNGNPQAISHFEKVINGLAKLPEARRRAADGRLQSLYLQAVVGLQSFHATRDRFAEALEVIQSAAPNTNGEEREYLDQHIIGLQFMTGQNEAALAGLRTLAELPDSDITDWNPVIWGYIRADRPHDALPVLDELAQRFGVADRGEAIPDDDEAHDPAESAPDTPATPDMDADEDPRFIRAAIDGMRGVVLLETGDMEGGIAAFDRSLEYEPGPYRNSLHLLYTRLSNAGRHEDALRYIQRDSRFPARAGFWRGLTYQRMGRRDDARAAWRAVTELPPQELQRAPVEVTMASFYLGDPQGQTLTNLLDAIRNMEQPNWTMLMLAGVGFVIRKDYNTALNDFRLAISMVKSLGEGRKMPVGVWHMIKDLFNEEEAERFASFFDLPLPKSAASQA